MRRAKLIVFLLALYPLTRLVVLGLTGGLGANPIEFVTRSTGLWTLVGLLVTLSITPLRRFTGRAELLRFRRMLGLFAFFYACLHASTYFWLDQFFDFRAIAHDIVKRPFVTVGFAAFVLLLPLAATSSQAMMRRLGRNWSRLHRLVYAIAVLGVLHFVWLVKRDLFEPLIYGVVLAVLLVMRTPWGVAGLQKMRVGPVPVGMVGR